MTAETRPDDRDALNDAGETPVPSSGSSHPGWRVIPLRTVARTVRWEGVGLHSGASCRVTVSPSDTAGIYFQAGKMEIPAVADYVTDTQRCTVLSRSGISVSTVEHLLAALVGVGIWGARIAVEGGEIPILDGSAIAFTEQLLEAGIREVGSMQGFVPSEGQVTGGEARRTWHPCFDSQPEVTFTLIGDHPMLAGQSASHALNDADAFACEIAPCRTWSPIEQVQPLLDQNLIRGGSLDNAVIVYPTGYSSPLRRPEEPARHKLLDLIGDLALVGAPVLARIDARGGGHALNLAAACALRAAARSTPGGESEK